MAKVDVKAVKQAIRELNKEIKQHERESAKLDKAYGKLITKREKLEAKIPAEVASV